MSVECPKCGSNASFVEDGPDILIKCLCGLLRPVLTKSKEGRYVVHQAPAYQATLPKNGTLKQECLMVLADNYPRRMNSTEIAANIKGNTNALSTAMLGLLYLGLVTRLEVNRGQVGGSLWELSETAKNLLNIK